MTEFNKTFIHIGRRVTTQGKLAYFYADGETTRGYAKPLLAGAKIGTQIEVTWDSEDRMWTGGAKGPRAIGQLDETDARLIRWSTEEKGDLGRAAHIREQQRILKEGVDPLRRQLEPVREHLAGLSPDRRVGAVSWILTYLMGSGR